MIGLRLNQQENEKEDLFEMTKMSKTKLKRIFEPDPRIELIQQESFYEYNQAFDFWQKLMILMRQPRTKTKIKGYLLTGAPDSGKSTLVRQFEYEYLENVEGGHEKDIMIFNVPQGVGAVQVFAHLCRELGIPDIPKNSSRRPITDFVVKAAAKLKQDKKLLIVDEFQNLYEVPGTQRKRIISAFNQLINLSRIPIVLVGVTGVETILKNIDDDTSDLKGTFSSRFPEFRLKKWKFNEEFAGLVMSIYNDLHFRSNDDSSPFYADNEILETIIELTHGLLGGIIHLLKETAIKIIREGISEKITLKILLETARELGIIPQNAQVRKDQ